MDFTGYYKDYCSNFASTPTTSALRRIGARLPEEVLGRILSFIHRGDYIGKEEKHPVGQLALTCRYWAIKCQPAIFKWIELRSGKDLEGLLSLMASPLSCVASYIKKLRLYQKVTQDPPWLHLVALRLVPELALDWGTFLQLSNAADIRSIHDGLPRSYSSFSSHISHLYLSNVRFKSFADLLHLVDEMPSLQTLECCALTWPASLDTPPVGPPRRCIPPHLYGVSMDQCTDNSASVHVLYGRRSKVRDSPTASFDFGLRPEQQRTIYQLVFPCAENSPYCSICHTNIDSAYNMIDVQVDDIDGQVDDIVYKRLFNFYFLFPSMAGPISIIEVEIIGIYIVEYEDGDSDMWKKTFEQLPPLQKLVLGFKSRENMDRFVHEVVKTKLDNLSSADRVKYAILQGHEWNGIWLRASVDSEELKETGLLYDSLWRI